MLSAFRRRFSRIALVCGLALSLIGTARAGEGPIRKLSLDPDAEVIGLFDGLERGLFEARVVPQDQYQSKVFITNTGEEPLTVALPDAAVGVHVLKQFPSFTDSQLPFGNDNSPYGSGQPVGGPFSPLGQQGFPNAQGNQFNVPGCGFFSIPAEQTVQLRMHTVCLAYGKPTPMSKMKYALQPLEERVADPALRRILAEYDPRRTDRRTVQAAAWHLMDGMSWQRLAQESYGIGVKRPFFAPGHLRAAAEWVRRAEKETRSKTEPNPRVAGRAR